jgi:DNA-binding response OmpR family regulator
MKGIFLILNKKILIVEDDVDSNELMTLFFKDYFKSVFSAFDGEKAYSIYLDEDIDVIITDIEMPKLNGIELIKRIRVDDKSIPVFILSSKSDLSLLLEAIPLKLEEYVLKPLNFEKLTKIANIYKKKYAKESYEIGYMTNYSFITKSLTYNDKNISLTNNEISLLELLIYRINSSVSYEDIAFEVYDNDNDNISINSVRILITRLRKKIPSLYIESIPKLGYTLTQGVTIAT